MGEMVMDDVIELVLELILDGMVEAAGSKRVPLPIRIALTTLLAIFVLGVFGLLLWIGIQNKSVLMVSLAVALLMGCIIGIYFKVKKYRNKKP